MFRAGKKFMQWGAINKTKKVAAQLEKIDPRWSKSLLYEMYYWKLNYANATKIYESTDDLLDITHYHQFQLFLLDNQFQKAIAVMPKVYSPASKQLMYAQLLYKQLDWHQLADMNPINVQTKRWQLMAKIKMSDQSAIDKLAVISEVNYFNIEQLKLLANAYLKNGNMTKANWMANQITQQLHLRLSFYQSMIEVAKSEQNISWVTILNNNINEIQFQLEN